MSIAENLHRLRTALPQQVTLIAVSKTKTNEEILQAYNAGQRVFGENRVQEVVPKAEALPKDIAWHLIGHLQTNKVKYIAPFVAMIHSVDSEKLLQEIDKQAAKNNRIIDVLLQVYIASEETKFGLDFSEAEQLLASPGTSALKNVRIAGLMGMATNTDDEQLVRKEFSSLRDFFDRMRAQHSQLVHLSMGMSSDYSIAVDCGSTMVRVGSAIFGER